MGATALFRPRRGDEAQAGEAAWTRDPVGLWQEQRERQGGSAGRPEGSGAVTGRGLPSGCWIADGKGSPGRDSVGWFRGEWTKAFESPPFSSLHSPVSPALSPRQGQPLSLPAGTPATTPPSPPCRCPTTPCPVPSPARGPSQWVTRSRRPTTKEPTASPRLARGPQDTPGREGGTGALPLPAAVCTERHLADAATRGVLQDGDPAGGWTGTPLTCLPGPCSGQGGAE